MAVNHDVNINVIGKDQTGGLFGSIANGLGNVLQIAGGFLVANVFGSIASQIGDMTREALDASSTFQGLQIQYESLMAREMANSGMYDSTAEALGHAAGPAKDLLEWVKKIAVTTPFTVESLSKTMAMSMAMGFTSERAKSLTMAIGSFTAGMGLGQEHMQRIIYNFGQMNAAGKVTTREMRDLTSSLVPVKVILKSMAAEMGVSTDEMEKMAKKGDVSVEFFLKHFQMMVDADFPGAMERMSQTAAGVSSNFHDFIGSILGVELLGPIMARFTMGTKSMMDEMMRDDVRKAFTSMGTSIPSIIDAITAKLGIGQLSMKAFGDGLVKLGERFAFLGDWVDQKKPIIEGLRIMFRSLMPESTWQMIDNAAEALKKFVGFVSDLKEKAGIAMSIFNGSYKYMEPEAWDAIANTPFAKKMLEIKGIFDGLLIRVDGFMNVFKTGMSEGLGPLDSFKYALMAVLPPTMSKDVAGFVDGLKGIGAKVGEAFTWIIDHKDEVITGFQNVGTAISNGFKWLMDNRDQIGEILVKVGEGLAGAFKWVIDNKDMILGVLAGIGAGFAVFNVLIPLIPVILDVGNSILTFIAAGGGMVGIVATMNSVFGPLAWIITGLAVVIGLLVAVIVANWGPISAWFASTVAALTPLFQTVGAAIGAVWNGIVAAFTSAWALIQPTLAQYGPQFALIGTALSDMWNAISPVLAVLGTAIGALAVLIVGIVVGITTGIMTAVGVMMPFIVQIIAGVTEVVSGIVGFVSGLFQILQGIFSGNGEAIAAGWATLWTGVVNVFTGIWNAILGVVGGVIAGLIGLIAGFITGVVTFFQTLSDTLVGHSIVPDMLNAILQFFTDVLNQVLTFVGGILLSLSDSWSAFWTTLTTTMQTMWDGIYAAIQTGWGSLVELFTTQVQSVITSITSIDWGAVGQGIIDGIVKGISGAAEGLAGAAVAAANSALKAVKDALGMHSPSRVFQSVGVLAMKGLEIGWTDGAKDATTALTNSLRNVGDAVPMLNGGLAASGAGAGQAQTQVTNNYYPSNELDIVDISRRVAAEIARR